MEQWAEDLERVGHRRLEPAEYDELLAQVRARQRRLSLHVALVRVAAVLIAAPGVAFVLFAPPIGETITLRIIAGLGLVCLIGAIPALFLVPMWRAARRWLPWLARAEGDLVHDSVVAIYEAPGASIEVLPTSGVIVTRDGNLVPRWERVEIVEVAQAAESLEVPWPWPVDGLGAGVVITQRHMSTEEGIELARHVGRVLRRALATSAVTFWISGMVFRAIENAARGQDLNTLSRAGWLVALGMGLVPLLFMLRRRVLLGRDLAYRRIGVLRNPAAERIELLPHTRHVWSVNGRPASWRTSPVWI